MWTFLFFVGALLSSSARADVDCETTIAPVHIDKSMMSFQNMKFIMGYSDHVVFDALLKVTEMVHLNSTPTDDGLLFHEDSKMNGTCISSTYKGTIADDVVTVNVGNATTTMQMLPGCDGCFVFLCNTTARNMNQMLQLFNLDPIFMEEEITSRSFYLMAKDDVKESDVANFKHQAKCLGMAMEPAFIRDSAKGNCEGQEILKRDFQ